MIGREDLVKWSLAFTLAACVTPPPASTPATASPVIPEIVVVRPPAAGAASDNRWTPDRTRTLADSVRAILRDAGADSAFPGAYVIVGNAAGVLVRDSVGRIDWAADAPMPNAHTLWDLASVTKVVGLTSALMQLVADGRVNLDARVQQYLPAFVGTGKERVTVRQLMTHTGGLPSWRPLHKEAVGPDSAVALVMITALDTVAGTRMAYSDLGLITMGKLVERVSGQPLDRYLADRVFRPAGMMETMYNPPVTLRPRIAPTEIDSWRARHLRGEVHDENAFALGGVAGHAGLFSSAEDLARFARMYLNRGTLDGLRILDSATIRQFTAWQDSARHNRGLGWMKPARGQGWFGGVQMSTNAYGHTGFTGTSLYMDPDRDVFVILLSNRVNPTRMNAKIGRVRTRLADGVMSVLLGTS